MQFHQFIVSLVLSYSLTGGIYTLAQDNATNATLFSALRRASNDGVPGPIPPSKKSDIYEQRKWTTLAFYGENTCKSLGSAYGGRNGICAKNFMDLTTYFMPFAGQSSSFVTIMYSFFSNDQCSGAVPIGSTISTLLGNFPGQGPPIVEPVKNCIDLSPFAPVFASAILQDKTPSFKKGVVFSTFSSPTECQKNTIQEAVDFFFLQKGQCGGISGDSSFIRLGAGLFGVKIQRCDKDKVIVEVYTDPSCTTFIQKVEFPKSDSCASGDQTAYGAAAGFANFKCV